MSTKRLRICPFCEATCGLEIVTRDRTVVSIRGDADDPLSRGYICPKGPALKHLDADPDRLRRPLIRRGSEFEEASWELAFAEVARRLPAIQAEHGCVVLEADQGGERHLRRTREAAHRAPLDLDLDIEARRLHGIHGGLGHLAAEHVALGAPVHARLDAQRLRRVAAGEPRDLAHLHRVGSELRSEPARERRAPGVVLVRHGARAYHAARYGAGS